MRTKRENPRITRVNNQTIVTDPTLSPGPNIVATLESGDAERDTRNARLLVAGQKMLEALEEVRQLTEDRRPDDPRDWILFVKLLRETKAAKMVRDAIAEAKGPKP